MTRRTLAVLTGLESATTASLATHFGVTTRKITEPMRSLRARNFVVTEGTTHKITEAGRGFLVNADRPVTKANVNEHKRFSEYLPAQPSDRSRNAFLDRPVWVPPPWVPARPGADDHKQYASRGIV